MGAVIIPTVRQRLPEPPKPTDRGVHGERPYWLWLPTAPGPWPAMVIVHGAGSRKENHGDFARACAAAGWAALAYDQRGHGESADEMGAGAVGDVARIARLLAETDGVDATRVCARGSSMGGLVAVHAAATSPALAGVIAICPAFEEDLLRALREDRLEFRAGPRARADLEAWLTEHDVREAISRVGGKPTLLIHARGDERVPWERSRDLHERASDPRKLILLPGGHHRSAQHDPELHGLALRWLERRLGEPAAQFRG
jgi:uncharacterized protein